MKISISNFKSIDTILDFEIKPFTVLSGNNSIGKSSFIQLLLLLKQTIYIDSTKYPLYLDGEYYSVKNYMDIVRGKQNSNEIKISFLIPKSDFEKFGSTIEKSIFDGFPNYNCKLDLVYGFESENPFVKEFVLTYLTPEKNNYIKFFQDKRKDNDVIVETNNAYFLKPIDDAISEINYSSIFPSSIEIIRYNLIEDPKGGSPLINEEKTQEYPNLTSIKSFLKKYFSELYYIGPLRIEPKDLYSNTKSTNWVGVKGEYVADVLEKRQNELLMVSLPVFENDLIKYEASQVTLLYATNYWICSIFKFAKKIFPKGNDEFSSIILIDNNGTETTIKHVGFGISQILPIIVQGLLLKEGSTLVLEQPEIHLHPKIQSLLFDFLHSLILQKKNIIVETHSDHFITRLRRRIAEDEDSQLLNDINLSFIEKGKNKLEFKTLDIDEFGSFDYFPEDFIERPDIELKALINAQMKKRIIKERQE